MDAILVTTIIGIMLNLVLLKAILELSRQITEEVEQLDGNIAEAIASVVAKFGISDQEPVNPIQAAIAQMMLGKINDIKPATTVLRDDNGFFKKTE